MVVFPNQSAFDHGTAALSTAGAAIRTLAPPVFAEGILPPALMVSGPVSSCREALETSGATFSGIIPYHPLRREVSGAHRAHPVWKEAVGTLEIESVVPSESDPARFRVSARTYRSLDPIIPYMARVIRGGAYRPEVPLLAFEEDHRLVVFGDCEIVICRADDILDIWVMIRTAVDLINTVWTRRDALEPENRPRQGIGAMEIYKRLPAHDCKQCNTDGCMEYARSVLLGTRNLDQCPPLTERKHAARRKSLRRLLRIMGVGYADAEVR